MALHSLGGRSRVEVAGTSVIERLFDVLALLLLHFAALLSLPAAGWRHAAGVLAITLTVALGGAVAILRRYGDRPVRFALRPLAR